MLLGFRFFPGTEDINNPYQPHSQDAPSSVYDTTEKAVEAAKQDTVSEETKEHLSIVEHSVEENATEDNTQAKEVVECEQASEQKMSPVVEWPDHDDYLVRLQQILSDIHREYFSRLDAMTELSSSSTSEQQQPQLPSLRDVMPSLRSKVLAGCVLVFSGVFPLHMPLERSKAFQIATSLGAVVQSELQFAHNSSKKDRRRKLKPHKASSSRKRAKHTDDKASRDEIGADSSSNSDVAVAEEGLMGADSGATTHLVAARANTSKWRAARRAGISVVNPKWLWACHYRWERVPEHLFSLSNAAADDDDDVGEADGGGGDKRKLSTDMRRMKQREERQFAKLRHEAKRAAREEERQLAAALPPPARFDLADHPLLRMSRDDLEDMEEEVNAAQGTDNSDSNDSSDSSGADGKRDRELRQAVLSSSPSLSGECANRHTRHLQPVAVTHGLRISVFVRCASVDTY